MVTSSQGKASGLFVPLKTVTKEPLRHDPWDIALEQGLLGALLVDNRLIDRVASELDPEHFYDPLHARIYEVLVYLITEGAVSPLLLHRVMSTDEGLREVGGVVYLAGLAAAAPAMPNISDYIRVLKELAVRRHLIKIGETVIDQAYLGLREAPTAKIAEGAMDALLQAGTSFERRTLSLGAVGDARLQKAEERLAGKEVKFITTGSKKLDRAMGGMQPGDHLIIAGRSGMGKSAHAGSIARAAAASGAPVLIISADMTKERWADRTLTEIDARLNPKLKPISYSLFRSGRVTSEIIERLAIANRHLKEWPIDICDEGDIALSRIRAKARAMAKRFPGQQGLLVTDFLQKIQADSKDRRRDEDITSTTYGLGDIAKDLGWSAVSLAQLKNKATDAKGKLIEEPPNAADIRESGGIEQAADILFAIHRKAFFIERREPEGRDYIEGPSPEWLAWNGEYRDHQHSARLIGFKNRDDSISRLNIDLWCDMGANLFLDADPAFGTPEVDTQDLLL